MYVHSTHLTDQPRINNLILEYLFGVLTDIIALPSYYVTLEKQIIPGPSKRSYELLSLRTVRCHTIIIVKIAVRW